MPFPGRNNREVLRRNKHCKVVFKKKYWGNVSEAGRHATKWLLLKDPKTRPTAKDAVQHPWFQYHLGNISSLPDEFPLIKTR